MFIVQLSVAVAKALFFFVNFQTFPYLMVGCVTVIIKARLLWPWSCFALKESFDIIIA